MSSIAPWADAGDVLALSSIREALIRQEDTIIFALIERAQFAMNEATYNPEAKQYAELTKGAADGTLDARLLKQAEGLLTWLREADDETVDDDDDDDDE